MINQNVIDWYLPFWYKYRRISWSLGALHYEAHITGCIRTFFCDSTSYINDVIKFGGVVNILTLALILAQFATYN